MPLRPNAQYTLGRRNGVENCAVHVEQQRAKGAVRKGTLAHGVGTAEAALKQLSENAECATHAHFEDMTKQWA